MIPDDAPHGMAIRWIGEIYSEELGERGEMHAEVRPGDLGTFIDLMARRERDRGRSPVVSRAVQALVNVG
jgi:hypothetical protein